MVWFQASFISFKNLTISSFSSSVIPAKGSSRIRSFGSNANALPNSTLFRITQEAVNNIVKHSDAEKVEIILRQRDEDILLEVNDDGQGFDLASIREKALQLQHLGLLGIQERAELVGGDAKLRSAPGRGTQILVSVPYHPPVENSDE